MLVTNNKKILNFPQDPEALENLGKELGKRSKDVLGRKVKFSFVEEPYPHLTNDADLSFQELKQLTLPDYDLHFRAIGDERVQLPEVTVKDIKHTYLPEEKAKLAEEAFNAQYELEQLHEEFDSVKKGYNSRIKALETKISDRGALHRQGYEVRTIRCHLNLDFENKVRVYTDEQSGSILDQEALHAKDYQLRLPLDGNKVAEATETDYDPFAVNPAEGGEQGGGSDFNDDLPM